MEPVFVILIVFTFVTIMVKMNLDYKRASLESKSSGGDKSLGVSELKGLIQDTVQAATAPLTERVEQLELRLDEQEARLLQSATETLLLQEKGTGKS